VRAHTRGSTRERARERAGGEREIERIHKGKLIRQGRIDVKSECVCVCVRERVCICARRERGCVGERECVCVRAGECVCVLDCCQE